MHDESGPPSSHGAPIGNTNAVGNAGGGAPEGNANAQIHGGWSDPEKFYARLPPAKQATVDEHEQAILDQARRTVPEMDPERRQTLARETAILLFQERTAEADAWLPAGRGFQIETEWTQTRSDGTTVTVQGAKLNPALTARYRLSARRRQLYDELQLFPTS